MRPINFTYIILALLVVFSGCRKDEKSERQVTVEPSGDPKVEVVGGVTGFVVDEEGTPVSNASVRVYNHELTTNDNGIFYLNNQRLNRNQSVVHVEKDGFFDGFKSFIPAVGKKSFIKIAMVNRREADLFSSNEGGTISIGSGAELRVPPNAIVYQDGKDPYNGQVYVYSHWYNPGDPDLGVNMPGNLSGITMNEDEVQLGTYGMISVELETSEGRALQLADEATATLSFPVDNSLEPPNSIALWSFDEWDGVWQEEGQAQMVDGFYTAEVSHFSFWNCDAPFPLVNIEGRIVSNQKPVANFPVTIRTFNLMAGYGSTDSEGYFRGKVPKDELLTLNVRHCNETIVTHEIGSFTEDMDLGDIEVDVENFLTIIQGRLIGCFNDPLQSAYGLLKSGDKVEQVITPIANQTNLDGTFSTIVSGCQNGNYTLQFFDPENIKSSEIFDISPDLEFHDFQDVRICDGVEEFIQYSVDGELAPLLTEADVYFSNEEKLIIRGGATGGFESFDIDIFATSSGVYTPSSVSVQGSVGPSNPELQMRCGDHLNNAFTCSEFNVTITSFTNFVSGTFSGVLYVSQDSLGGHTSEFDEFSIEGSFNIEIDESVTTGEISGILWFDENSNNVRDDDEDREIRPQSVNLRKVSGIDVDLFPSYLNTHNNAYKFTDLLPGTYVVRVYNREDYEIVISGVGSDERDSDFAIDGNFYVSDERVINTNEEIENVDLGFVIPEGLGCGNFSVFGCAPNITIVTNVIGGLPPYTASFDGQSVTSTENPILTLTTGGFVEIQMEDAIGNKCQVGEFVNSYNNTVFGLVWQDVEGTTPNVFDSGDIRLNEILVRLLNESGELIAEGVTSNGNYFIRNIPPGNYFVEIALPANLDILDVMVDEPFGNDINKSTGRSDVIVVGDCNSSIRINAGLTSI
ncbi:MAG: SdrD B-like domain-containing protein [Bacteroidota bacterium]